MPGYRAMDGLPVDTEGLADLVKPFGPKYAWFLKAGYRPHTWQTLFHTMPNEEREGALCRFRHLVAGRRGGKTLSAAWELVYYLTNPEVFHWDAHRERSSRPIWAWVLTKDHPAGLPALIAFRQALDMAIKAGLLSPTDFKENRGHRWFEFANGSFVQFKSADEPEGLRGAGLDILWIDEAAFIPTDAAWNVVRPALSDKLGLVVSTTTPSGKNWFYETFWNDEALLDPRIGRVEYWSIHNPYFPREEWEYAKATMHPMLFKQEYMASFDSMAGKELHGDWLKYYEPHEVPRNEDKSWALKTYIGVDPAISLSDRADKFSMALVGVAPDNTRAFLLEQFAGRIPFAEQLDLIYSWWVAPPNGWPRPEFIGVESTAYQAALAQQLEKMPGFPPVVPLMAKGKKFERILSMAPWFRLGKIRVRKEHRDFINEWVDYDSELKNPKDDCLDAVEIALRTAGVLLPSAPIESSKYDGPAGSIEELALRMRPSEKWSKDWREVDDHLGADW